MFTALLAISVFIYNTVVVFGTIGVLLATDSPNTSRYTLLTICGVGALLCVGFNYVLLHYVTGGEL